MDDVAKSLWLRRLIGLALLLQFLAVVVPGPTLAPHPPKYYPLSEYLVSDVFFGLSIIPILMVFRRGGMLARIVAALLCLPLSIHIFRSYHMNAHGLLHELFRS
jgi:hypothetical protein